MSSDWNVNGVCRSVDARAPSAKVPSASDVLLALHSSAAWHAEQGRPHSAGVDSDAAAVIARQTALNTELLRELKSMTLLAKSALLCTTVEIAREAKPLLAAADAAIARAQSEE